MERMARALKLRDRDPSPRWFKIGMMVTGCVLLVSALFSIIFGLVVELFDVGAISLASSFLLVLGADRLKDPRGTAAAVVRLVGMLLWVAGAVMVVLAWTLF